MQLKNRGTNRYGRKEKDEGIKMYYYDKTAVPPRKLRPGESVKIWNNGSWGDKAEVICPVAPRSHEIKRRIFAETEP